MFRESEVFNSLVIVAEVFPATKCNFENGKTKMIGKIKNPLFPNG